MNHRTSRPSHLRLVDSPRQRARRAWLSESTRHAREFMARQGHRLSDPSLASWVLEQCAELVIETAHELPGWAALPVEELWRRLDNLQRFFPQPRLIVAHHETLCAFLPWLCTAGLLDAARVEALLARLEEVSARTLTRALEQLATRCTQVASPPWES